MSFIVLPLLYAFFFAFLTAYIASKKNYKTRSWFWLGFLLGFIATGILLFQPKKDGKSPSQPKEINNNNLTIKEIDNPMDSQTITAPYKRISPGYMLLMLISTFAISIIYYRMALLFSNNPMPMFDYVVFTCVVAIIIVGAYQIFFWVQNNNYFFKTHCLAIGIDKYIPFWPIWVWPYSFIYYIMIGMVVVQISSLADGLYHIFGGLMLLLAQGICFMIFPCRVPKSYREYEIKNLSTRYLKFVQALDNGRNCFPSMHNSVAAYVGVVLLPTIGVWSYVFIASIAVSSLLVKQHQLLDIVPGLLLGWGIHSLVALL